MHVVTEVQHIVIMAEHKLLDYKDVEKRFADQTLTLPALATGINGFPAPAFVN